MLEPPVRDAAPTDDAITDYDQMLLVTYLRLLDAEADRSATWEEVCRIVLRIDPARDPARARRAYDTHRTRARWMTEVGWRQLMRMSRLYGGREIRFGSDRDSGTAAGGRKGPLAGEHPLRWDRRGIARMVLRVWASTGFHPASPGPALMSAIGSMTGLPAGSLRTLLTYGVTNRSQPRWAARLCNTSVPVIGPGEHHGKALGLGLLHDAKPTPGDKAMGKT
jgi:hypothetical protein